MENLSKDEFKDFVDNHFHTHCAQNAEDFAEVKTNQKWIIWIVCGIALAVATRLALLFFGI